MNSYDKKDRVTKIFVVCVATIFFSWVVWVLIYRPHWIPHPPNQEYLTPGIYKVVLEGHEYYKANESMTHSENCSCKK